MNIWQRFYTRSQKSAKWILILLIVLLPLIALCSLVTGSSNVTLGQIWNQFMQGDTTSSIYRILVHVRIPRTLAAALAGAALSVSGVIIQTVLNNSMAGPSVIGVNSGGGFFAMLIVTVFPGAYNRLPEAAFIGALLTSLLIYLLAIRTGASRMTIILAGIAVNSIFSAGIDALSTLYPDAVVGANSFMMGGFSGMTLKALFPACWYILAALLAAWILGSEMDVLLLGEETAASLGVHVSRLRLILIILSSILAGSAVSFAGLLGFVGLLVPHMARFLIGSSHRLLIPAAALIGASFVVLCDLLSRIIFAPFELPVGIIMSFLGGPFFLWLLLRRKRSRLYD